MTDYPFSAAIRTVREGLSARAGLRAYREAGGAIGDAAWFKMVTEARTTVAARIGELSAPLDQRPTRGEATVWSTRNASGWLQQVEVIVRIRATSEIRSIPFSVTGKRPLTRQQAKDKALATYTPEGTDGDSQIILGVEYVGSIIMQPGTL
jgi:hypothetical protein